MAINFTTTPGTSTETPVEVTATPGVTLDLNKGNVLDLAKASPGLSKVTLGAGWDVSGNGVDFDLDISVFLLNSANKITSGADVVFYNNKTSQGVTLSGDNRTGAGDGDDETITIDLNAVPASVTKIVAAVTIDQAVARRQTFGMVNNSYIRLVNSDTNAELARFTLKDDYSIDTAVLFAELVRVDGTWNFHTLGEGKQADLNGIAAMFS